MPDATDTCNRCFNRAFEVPTVVSVVATDTCNRRVVATVFLKYQPLNPFLQPILATDVSTVPLKYQPLFQPILAIVVATVPLKYQLL